MNGELFYSKEELERDLQPIQDSAQILKILGAYDMAESVYLNRYRANGNPHFFHISRICRIIISELKILESDIVIASMLQDVLNMSREINPEVLDYNFGSYVSYLIDSLTEEYKRQKQMDWKIEHIQDLGGPDGLIIRLSKCLDNLRFLDFDIVQNPISYLNSIKLKYFDVAEHIENKHISYLLNEIRKESNKIIG